MKKIASIILAITTFFLVTSISLAFDIKTLDRISVLMPKSQVLAILGQPDEIGKLGNGLKADIYKVSKMDPMVGTGCIYDDDQYLKGQAFIFKGNIGKQVAEQIKACGFMLLEEKENFFLLSGKDDDTGRPIMVTVVEDGGLTTVVTFEKGFYDQRVK
jgi:hypothetical protein